MKTGSKNFERQAKKCGIKIGGKKFETKQKTK